MTQTYEELIRKITGACTKETAFSPKTWSSRNPTEGHCGLAACYVHELYDCKGEIVVVEYVDPHGTKGRHFFNILPNGEQVDTTRAQFSAAVKFTPELGNNEALIQTSRNFLKRMDWPGCMYSFMFSLDAFHGRYDLFRKAVDKQMPPRPDKMGLTTPPPKVTPKNG